MNEAFWNVSKSNFQANTDFIRTGEYSLLENLWAAQGLNLQIHKVMSSACLEKWKGKREKF